MKNWIKAVLARTPYRLVNPSNQRGVNWIADVAALAGTDGIPVAFDVGANAGQTTLRLRDAFPRAAIHAFEPVSDTFARLAATVDGLSDVTAHLCALGRSVGEAPIELRLNSELNSIRADLPMIPGEPALATGSVENVRVDTVDAVSKRLGLAAVDLLKTDTEGYDAEVLAGASGMLSAGRVRFVFAEAGVRASDRRHTPLRDLLSFLGTFGFDLYALYDLPPRRAVEAAEFCNALFVGPNVGGRFVHP